MSRQYNPSTTDDYALLLGGTYASVAALTIASPPASIPVNSMAYTGDAGQVINTGAAWVSITALAFSGSLTPAALSASQDNYTPSGYIAGATRRLLLTAASGGSTITGLLAAPDGFQILIVNQSTTDAITFAHLSSSSLAANRFSCAGAASVDLAPLAAAYANYVGNVWMFA